MRKWRSITYIKLFVILGVVALVIGLVTPAIALKPPPPAGPVQLAGKNIAQFVDPLPSLRGNNSTAIILEMKEFKSMVMPTGFVPAAGAEKIPILTPGRGRQAGAKQP